MKIESVTGAPLVKARFEDDDTVDLDIAPEAKAMVMKYMTNIYDNPIEATAREVIFNGIDAEGETGDPKAVKITIPSAIDPNFVVEDQGVGMSYDTVRKVYRMYGVSTKRKSNDSVGGFGLGCKAPLAIEKKFYLKTTKDGMTTMAEIYWDAADNFKMDLYEPYESDLPNGTLVKIPLVNTSVYAFERAIFNVLSYTDPDLYNLFKDGQEVEKNYVFDNSHDITKLICELDDGTKIYEDNNTQSFNSHWSNTNTLVMGGVKYAIKKIESIDYDRLMGSANNFTIVAPIGAVDLAPSRENVQMTKKSIAFIRSAYEKYVEAFVEVYKQGIENAKSHGEAIVLRARAANYINTKGITYKGKPFQRYYDLTHTTRVEKRQYDSNTENSLISRIDLTTLVTTYLVTGDFTTYADSSFRRGIKLFMDHHDLEEVRFVLLNPKEPKIETEWITDNENFRFITREQYMNDVTEQRKAVRKDRPASTRDKIEYLVLDTAPIENEATSGYIPDWQYEQVFQSVPHDEIQKKIPYITKNEMNMSRLWGQIDDVTRYNAGSVIEVFRTLGYEGKIVLLMDHKKPSALEKRTDAVPFKVNIETIFNKYYEDYVSDRVNESAELHDSFKMFVKKYKDHLDSLDDTRFKELLASKQEKQEEKLNYTQERILELLFGYGSNRDSIKTLLDDSSKAQHEVLGQKYRSDPEYSTLLQETEALMDSYIAHIPLSSYGREYSNRGIVTVMNAVYNEILNPAPEVV